MRFNMEHNIIVNESCSNLRALARHSLSGRWNLALMGTLVYFALTTIPVLLLNAIFAEGESNQAGISSVYNLVIAGPMILGYAMFCISIFRKRETSPSEVFYGFERFTKAFGLYLVVMLFTFLWTLLFIIPGIIAALRYSMSFYILADNPDIGIMEAINRSKVMMRGNKWKFFCLNLSFIGWAFLCVFTFGIGLLWLMPYMENAFIAFYDIANGSLRAVRSLETNASLINESEEANI
ncbi:MAG: DUF975 family protein [Anaerovoracaceae bacterium]